MNRMISMAILLMFGIFNNHIFAGDKNNKLNIKHTVEGINKLTFDLYAKLSKETKGNIFFSPTSISTCLSMVYAGARSNTEKEMAKVLYFTYPQKGFHSAEKDLITKLSRINGESGSEFQIANAIWPDKGLNISDEYIKLLKENYNSELIPLDLGDTETAIPIINAWVEKKTKGKIKDIIQGGPLGALVLTNAIYFKGQWEYPFKEKNTKVNRFYFNKSKGVRVPIMKQTGDFRYAGFKDVQVLELPYSDTRIKLLIFLPRDKDGLKKLEDKINIDRYNKTLKSLKEFEVTVSLPQFTYDSKFELSDVLKEMGMGQAFSPYAADFSGIAEGLYIFKVLHKAFIDVNENGTEAAAATVVMMDRGLEGIGEKKRHVVFNANHPFIYLIRDESTGAILFMGKMFNPKKNNS